MTAFFTPTAMTVLKPTDEGTDDLTTMALVKPTNEQKDKSEYGKSIVLVALFSRKCMRGRPSSCPFKLL
jgi:hypothetical protein